MGKIRNIQLSSALTSFIRNEHSSTVHGLNLIELDTSFQRLV